MSGNNKELWKLVNEYSSDNKVTDRKEVTYSIYNENIKELERLAKQTNLTNKQLVNYAISKLVKEYE